jgi:WD40 repeat protein
MWHNSPHLALANRHLAAEPLSFNRTEATFLRASEERRRVRARRIWTGVAGAFALVAGLAVAAWVLSFLADDRAKVAESQRLAAQARIEAEPRLPLAHLLSLEAYRVRDTLEARSSLLYALQRQPALVAQHRRHDQSEARRAVYDVALSADGRWLASGGADGTVVLCDAAGGRVAGDRLRGYGGSVLSLAFSPDGRTLVSTGLIDPLFVWDLETRSARRIDLPQHLGPECVAFSADGRTVAVAGQDPQVFTLDLGVDPPTWALFADIGEGVRLPARTRPLAFSPNGETLAVACTDGRVRLYGTRSRALRRTLTHDPGGELAWAVAFHPTAPLVATTGRNKEVRLWDATTGQPWPKQLTDRPKREANALAFGGDGRLLACAAEGGRVEVWHLPPGPNDPDPQLVSVLAFHQANVTALGFSRDGGRLASASFDGLVALWETTNFQQLASTVPSGEGECQCVRFAPNGSHRFAGAAAGELRVWGPAESAPAGGRWQLVPWDGKSEEILFRDVAFSRDGKRVAACGQDRLFVRDTDTGAAHDIDVGGDRQQALAVMFDQNPNRIFVVRWRGYWQEWDVGTRTMLAEHRFAPTPTVRYAAVRPSDGSVAWQCDEGVRFARGLLYQSDAESRLVEAVPDAAAVAFSPDGKLLAWGREDGTIGWQAVDGDRQSPRRLRNHTNLVTALAFDDTGTVLASGDASGAIILWDVATAQMIGAPILNRRGRPGIADRVTSLAFAPGGRALFSCSDGAGLALWDTDPDSWARRCRLVPDENLSASQWVQYFGPDTPYRKTVDDLPPGDGVTEEMMATPGRAGVWLVALGLPCWAAACLFLVPWESLGRFRASPRSAAGPGLVLVVAFVAFAAMPRATRPGIWPLWGEKLALLAAIAGVSVVCAWLQKRLTCRWVPRLPRVLRNRLKFTGVRRYLRSMFQPHREPGTPPGGRGPGGHGGSPPGPSRR